MVTHAIVVALLAAAPAASPEPTTSETESASAAPRSAQELRNAVHAALRRQATARGAEQQAAVRALTAVYREVSTSTSLPPRERRQLAGLVRSRLMRTSKALARRLAKSAGRAKRAGAQQGGGARDRPPANRAILAQAQGNAPAGQAAAGQRQAAGRGMGAGGVGGFGVGAQIAGAAQSWNAQTNRNAEQLIELIQNTIAPSSWEANGGPGTMMYFAPGQVLVIRQRGDVHQKVSGAIRALRGN